MSLYCGCVIDAGAVEYKAAVTALVHSTFFLAGLFSQAASLISLSQEMQFTENLGSSGRVQV